MAFGRRCGELHIHSFIPSLPDHREIIVLKARNGAEENLRLANAWHPDLSYSTDPPLLGILRMLFQHREWKELHCRFYWERISIAVWDNRCTAHYAVGDYTEPREMHRVTVIGSRLD